ncbi:hypothetical protein KCP69_18335 [Salmonella enterica subsp. enterica]|nr:hypothetical protein KCP69_18335 [Salmonella enterica subsp. enterica]
MVVCSCLFSRAVSMRQRREASGPYTVRIRLCAARMVAPVLSQLRAHVTSAFFASAIYLARLRSLPYLLPTWQRSGRGHYRPLRLRFSVCAHIRTRRCCWLSYSYRRVRSSFIPDDFPGCVQFSVSRLYLLIAVQVLYTFRDAKAPHTLPCCCSGKTWPRGAGSPPGPLRRTAGCDVQPGGATPRQTPAVAVAVRSYPLRRRMRTVPALVVTVPVQLRYLRAAALAAARCVSCGRFHNFPECPGRTPQYFPVQLFCVYLPWHVL